MATYTPAALIPVTSLASTTTAAGSYSAPSATTGIARTFQAVAVATNGFHASMGADAVGTRIFSAQALTANVASIFNGWWVTASNTASAIQVIATTTSTTPANAAVAGYTYA